MLCIILGGIDMKLYILMSFIIVIPLHGGEFDRDALAVALASRPKQEGTVSSLQRNQDERREHVIEMGDVSLTSEADDPREGTSSSSHIIDIDKLKDELKDMAPDAANAALDAAFVATIGSPCPVQVPTRRADEGKVVITKDDLYKAIADMEERGARRDQILHLQMQYNQQFGEVGQREAAERQGRRERARFALELGDRAGKGTVTVLSGVGSISGTAAVCILFAQAMGWL